MGYLMAVSEHPPESLPEVLPEVLIVAAEASADAHAAEVVRALGSRAAEPLRPRFFGVAGPELRKLGVEAVARTEDLSVMGIVDVVIALPRILGIVRRVLREVDGRGSVVALLIDSPDLNLRLARKLRRRGVKVLYYIGPTLWAWRAGRAKTIQRFVDRMLVIFPFEAAVYAGLGVEASYVGNPLLDARDRDPAIARSPGDLRADLGLADEGELVALLPGSRPAEIRRCFPRLLGAALQLRQTHPTATFVVPIAATLERAFLQGYVDRVAPGLPLTLLEVPARQVLRAADAAAVVSGTATLEAALEDTPHLVVFRFTALAWFLARILVRVPHWSLTNLIADQALVTECFQNDARAEIIARELSAILPGGERRDRVIAGLAEVRRRLGGPGAAARVACALEKFMAREEREEANA